LRERFDHYCKMLHIGSDDPMQFLVDRLMDESL